MSNLELLQYLIGNLADPSATKLQAALELEGLSHSDTYDPANKCQLYKIAIMEIQTDKGVKSVTEGGYSITYTDGAIPAALNALAQKSGCDDLIKMLDTTPKIRNKSYLW